MIKRACHPSAIVPPRTAMRGPAECQGSRGTRLVCPEEKPLPIFPWFGYFLDSASWRGMTNATTLWRGMPAGRNGKRKSRGLVGGEELAGCGFITACPYWALFFFSHSRRRMSGRCFTLKCSKVARNPSPSGLAPITPTCTGVLSCSQALRMRVYSLSSNE